jgi:hypothetical protein
VSHVLLHNPFWNKIENFRIALAHIWLTEFCSILADCALLRTIALKLHLQHPLKRGRSKKFDIMPSMLTPSKPYNQTSHLFTFRHINYIRAIRNRIIHQTGLESGCYRFIQLTWCNDRGTTVSIHLKSVN